MKVFFLKLGLLVGSVLIVALTAEGISRFVYTPSLPFDLDQIKRDEEVHDSGGHAYAAQKNALGFREPELPSDVLADHYRRILFLGDSFTFGHGVDSVEHVFSELIEDRLNTDTLRVKAKYHIYNAGVDGTEPKDWYDHLNTLLPIYAPHHVFAIFFLRDGTRLCTSLHCYQKEIETIQSRYQELYWYRLSNVGKHVGNRMIAREFSDYYLERMAKAYLGSEEDRKPWLEQQQYLLKIRDVCRSRGLTFNLIIFPLLYGLESNYRFYDVEHEIARFAEANGISAYSLIHGFEGRKSEDLWVASDDQHPNERGHQIAADTLYPYLRQVIEEQ